MCRGYHVLCVVDVYVLDDRSYRSKLYPLPDNGAFASPDDGLHRQGGGSGRRLQSDGTWYSMRPSQFNSNNGCLLFSCFGVPR